MDDPKLKEQGRTAIKQYGCAGCHEIKGLEDEQRIGKELTTEGSTPIERLDFAMLTQDAEYGQRPFGASTRKAASGTTTRASSTTSSTIRLSMTWAKRRRRRTVFACPRRT